MGSGNKYMESDLREIMVLRENESMANHCTWRTGGVAERFFEPDNLSELVDFVADLPEDEPILWLGLGSNLLVRDGGIRGTVISTGKALTKLDFPGRTTMRAEAGVACGMIARQSVLNGCAGAEFLAGVPGTLGGALSMNAGAFGCEMWDIVKQVETIDRRGVQRVRVPADFRIGYRDVVGNPSEWFIAATLDLTRDQDGESANNLKALMAKRNASQPVGQHSSGSVFRNPPGDFAARLIESAGLKGVTIGGARVSAKHANFIINEGGASADDIESLITKVRTVVEKKHSVTLIPEVKIVGVPV